MLEFGRKRKGDKEVERKIWQAYRRARFFTYRMFVLRVWTWFSWSFGLYWVASCTNASTSTRTSTNTNRDRDRDRGLQYKCFELTNATNSCRLARFARERTSHLFASKSLVRLVFFQSWLFNKPTPALPHAWGWSLIDGDSRVVVRVNRSVKWVAL